MTFGQPEVACGVTGPIQGLMLLALLVTGANFYGGWVLDQVKLPNVSLPKLEQTASSLTTEISKLEMDTPENTPSAPIHQPVTPQNPETSFKDTLHFGYGAHFSHSTAVKSENWTGARFSNHS